MTYFSLSNYVPGQENSFRLEFLVSAMQVEKSGYLTLEVPPWVVISVELMEVSERGGVLAH